jgi:hypothetical protein
LPPNRVSDTGGNQNQTGNIVNDLNKVGAGKPLGCLPLATILSAGCEPAKVAAELQSRGFHTRICEEGECSIESGALYAWDRNALTTLLDGNKNVLEDAGWPSNADEFVQRVIRQHISKSDFPKLYSLIGRAFGDPG